MKTFKASIFIGEGIYFQLPKEKKATFKEFRRYKPDWIAECIDNDPDREFKDHLFESLEDYEDFWGDDWDNTGGFVYERDLTSRSFMQSSHINRREEYLCQFREGVKGDQIKTVHYENRFSKSKKSDCLMVGWEIFKTLTGKDGTAYFNEGETYAHSDKGLPSYPKPTLMDTWDGDDFFFDKKELGDFFGLGEDLEGLDAKFSASPCSRLKARIFPTKKKLTDEEKEMWMEKAKDFSGNQVKIVEVWN